MPSEISKQTALVLNFKCYKDNNARCVALFVYMCAYVFACKRRWQGPAAVFPLFDCECLVCVCVRVGEPAACVCACVRIIVCR